MKPGDRVRNKENGRRGAIEYGSTFTTRVTVVWDDGKTSFIKISALEPEPCSKIDECSILRSFRDRDVPEAIYEDMLREMCKRCQMKEESK